MNDNQFHSALSVKNSKLNVKNRETPMISKDEKELTPIANEMITEAIEKLMPTILERAHNKAKIKIEKQIQTTQITFFTVLGLFASMIAFLSISFQMFNTSSALLDKVAIIGILSYLLLKFNLALDYLAKNSGNGKESRARGVIVFFLMCALFTISAAHAMNYSYDSEQRYGPTLRILIAHTQDGQKIGQIVYSKIEGEIADITIVGDMRKKGIGTELFRRAIEDMKDHSVVSWYATSNAVGFYTKLGAQIDEQSSFGGANMSIDPKRFIKKEDK